MSQWLFPMWQHVVSGSWQVLNFSEWQQHVLFFSFWWIHFIIEVTAISHFDTNTSQEIFSIDDILIKYWHSFPHNTIWIAWLCGKFPIETISHLQCVLVVQPLKVGVNNWRLFYVSSSSRTCFQSTDIIC